MTPSFLAGSSNSLANKANGEEMLNFVDLLFLKRFEDSPFFELAHHQAELHYSKFLQFMTLPEFKSTTTLCEQFIHEINIEPLSLHEISKVYKKFSFIVLRRLSKATKCWHQEFPHFASVMLSLEKYLLSNIYTKYQKYILALLNDDFIIARIWDKLLFENKLTDKILSFKYREIPFNEDLLIKNTREEKDVFDGALSRTAHLDDTLFSVFERLDILFSALKIIFQQNCLIDKKDNLESSTSDARSSNSGTGPDTETRQADFRFLNGDQVFTLILKLVRNAKIPHFAAHLQFIRLFGLPYYDPLLCVYFGVQPSKTSMSFLDFYMTQLEAAVEYLTRPSLPYGSSSIFYSRSMTQLNRPTEQDSVLEPTEKASI